MSTVELVQYHAERSKLLDDRRNSTRRLVTDSDGFLLAGVINGDARAWHRRPLAVHVAATGTGTAHGAVMAACDGNRELGMDGDISDLTRAHRIDLERRCRRTGCRQAWPVPAAGGVR